MIIHDKPNIVVPGMKSEKQIKVAALLSGGLDSTVMVELLSKIEEIDITCLYVKYGSKHSHIEFEKAVKYCERKNIDLIELDMNSVVLNMDVKSDLINGETVSSGYVPFRNMMMISLLASFAESNDIHDIFIGANKDDYNGYWDCRPEFYTKMNETFSLNKEFSLKVHTPLVNKDKKDIYILSNGLDINVDVDTWTCYDPQVNELDNSIERCHKCDACNLLDSVIDEIENKDNSYYRLLLDESEKLIPSNIEELKKILNIGDEDNG